MKLINTTTDDTLSFIWAKHLIQDTCVDLFITDIAMIADDGAQLTVTNLSQRVGKCVVKDTRGKTVTYVRHSLTVLLL